MAEWLKHWIGTFGIYIVALLIVQGLIDVADKHGNWFFDGDLVIAALVYMVVKGIINEK